MNIYISTSNNYLHLLKPFSYLFNKFWSDSQRVFILGYKSPLFELPDNFKFISMGEQKGIQYWANDLHKFFSSIDDEHFIYSMEDHFILDYVDIKLFEHLKNYLNKDVGRISLSTQLANKRHDILETIENTNIIESHSSIQYRLCTQWSIWNKDFMLQYLKPNMSAWDFELQGFREPLNDNYRVIGVDGKQVVCHADAIRSSKFKENLNEKEMYNYNFNSLFWDRNKKYEKEVLNKNIINDMNLRGII